MSESRRRLAAIDVGSNTFQALVADVEDGRLTRVDGALEMPSLGAEVARTGRIGEAKTAEAMAILDSQVRLCRERGAEHVVIGATEAVRKAADGAEFRDRVSAHLGLPVVLIPPEREAQLSFAGVAAAHAAEGPWLMADLGGGSTELVAAVGRRIVALTSLPVGSGKLAAEFLSDPPTEAELGRLWSAVESRVRSLPGPAERLVVTGGTATYLPRVVAADPPDLLTRDQLIAAGAVLDAAPAAEVAAAIGVPAARVVAMRAGRLVLLRLLDLLGLDRLEVSHEGIREGMIMAWLERGHDWWRVDPVPASSG